MGKKKIMNFFKHRFLFFALIFLIVLCRRGTSDILEASRECSYSDMLDYLYYNVNRKDIFPYLYYLEGDEPISVVCVLCRSDFIIAFEYRENKETRAKELFRHSLSKSTKIKKKDIGLPFKQFHDKYGAAAYSYDEGRTRRYVYMRKYVSLVFPPPYLDTGISRMLTKVSVKDGIVIDIKEVEVSNP